jgi:acyl-ACP thioesterase
MLRFTRQMIYRPRYHAQVSDDDVLVPVPSAGRVVRGQRRVRLGDASPGGRLRFDATARYLQDIANDDARTADITDVQEWVVRRTVIEVHQEAVYGEELELTTFCGAIGGRWAQRRTSITGDHGARIEAAALWVCVDLHTMRPKVLAPDFHAAYDEAAGGRTVRAKLYHDDPPDDLDGAPYVVRFVDFDVIGHMNNAAYWTAMEEELVRRRDLRGPVRAEIEHRAGIEQRHAVRVVVDDEPSALSLWLVGEPGVFASARVRRLS